MRVAAYTGGYVDPSARLRVRQLIPGLAEHDIDVTEYPLPRESSRPTNISRLPGWAAVSISNRLLALRAGHAMDASWVCRQLLPTYLSIQSLVKKPMVLDVDDAIWLSRGGHRISGLARSAQIIVCGNQFLAKKFSEWNSNIVVIPTAVDSASYEPANAAGEEPGGVVIGWTGTSANFPYLYSVEDALMHVLNRYKNSKVMVVADKAPQFKNLPPSRVEFITWTPSAERSALNRMSIGLMPLEDSNWARGKCSYKMLSYMAAYLPVVVSPVGMNNEVLAQGEVGYGATNTHQWVDALTKLLEDRALRIQMGQAGRRLIEARYDVKNVAARYVEVFKSIRG